MFHSHDSWYWERIDNGGVRVIKLGATLSEEPQDGQPPTVVAGGRLRVLLNEHVLTAEAWASIVASVSARDETTETYYDALAFYQKEPTT